MKQSGFLEEGLGGQAGRSVQGDRPRDHSVSKEVQQHEQIHIVVTRWGESRGGDTGYACIVQNRQGVKSGDGKEAWDVDNVSVGGRGRVWQRGPCSLR